MRTNPEYFKDFNECFVLSGVRPEGRNNRGNIVYKGTVSNIIHTVPRKSNDYGRHKVGDVVSLDEAWIEGL